MRYPPPVYITLFEALCVLLISSAVYAVLSRIPIVKRWLI